MLIKENGYLMGESPPVQGKKLYIMGLDELELSREVGITIAPLAYVAGASITWEGDAPPKFPISWRLVAGFDHPAVKTRKALLEQIQIAHAMAASSGMVSGSNRLKGPAKVRLIIPGHISCSGLLESIRTTEKGPWDLSGSANLPTECGFSLTFIPQNNYNPERINDIKKETWLASAVLGKFYQS